MSENEIKPVLWDMSCETTVDGAEIPGTTDITPCPHGRFVHIDDYKSAIDRLTAERDVLRIEKDRLQEIRQQLEAERDYAWVAVDANWVSHQRVVKAEAERDAAVADAERLDWIVRVLRHDYARWTAVVDHNQANVSADQFRAAIDAARAEGGV